MTKKRSKNLETKVLERLAEGELVTAVCRDAAMPSIRQLQRWRRDDKAFDDRCWSAEGQGLMIQRATYIEQMTEAISEGGPGSGVAIQGLRELMHENARTAGRLIVRMSDRAHVSVDGSVEHKQIIIGWMENGQVREIGDRANSRPYIDGPKHLKKMSVTHADP